MTGGSKQYVNLDSGLDVSSSDMLVPVSEATFQHNWQKHQGKYLPNSLRFEKNGWAAGWNVYDFDYDIIEAHIDDITVLGTKYSAYAIALTVYRGDELDDKTIVVVPYNVNPNADITVSGNIIHGSINGKVYNITYNNGSFTVDNPYVGVNAVLLADYSFSLVVYDLQTSFDLSFDFYLPSDMTGDTISTVAYTGFNGVEHGWGDYKYNPTVNRAYFKGREIIPAVSGNLLGLNFNYDVSGETFQINSQFEKRYYEFDDCRVSDALSTSTLVTNNSDISSLQDFNHYDLSIWRNGSNPVNLLPGGRIVVDVVVPVWVYAYVVVTNGNLDTDRSFVYHNHVDATGLYYIRYNRGDGSQGSQPTMAITSGMGDAWITNITFVNGVLNTASLNNNVEFFGNRSIYSKYMPGSTAADDTIFRVAIPLCGHIVYELKYKRVASMVELSQNTDALEFVRISSADLSGNYDGRIYVDRSDKVRSYEWFYLTKTGVTADDFNGGGSFNFETKGRSGAKLYYTNVTDTDSTFWYFPDLPRGSGGNLFTTKEFFSAALDWSPVSYDFPIGSSLTFSGKNPDRLNHTFYNRGTGSLTIRTKEIIYGASFDAVIVYQLNDAEFRVSYNAEDKEYSLVPGSTYINQPDFSITFNSLSTKTIDCTVTLRFRNTARFPVSTAGLLLDVHDNIATLQYSGVNFRYNYMIQQFLERLENTVQVHTLFHRINLTYRDFREYVLAMQYTTDGTLSGHYLTFVYKGVTYTIDINTFISGRDSSISVLSTDVREPDKTKIIGKLNLSKDTIYQLIRQQWNSTAEVENYWWLDSQHILELGRYYFVLKHKAKGVDDWNGDNWSDVYKLIRTDVVPSNVEHYFVTNYYADDSGTGHALFLVFELDSTRIKCSILDPLDRMNKLREVFFELRKRNIGEVLTDVQVNGAVCYFNTYSVLSIETILASAKWTATVRAGKLIIGCHCNNNFNQWAAVLDLSSGVFERCIQGYGFVGVKGDLTGGQIPARFFDAGRGFNSAVNDITTVVRRNENVEDIDNAYEVGDISRINVFDDVVVGDAEQQWYVCRYNYGVVSHLVFNNGYHRAEIIPITNNYDSIYKSPSFMSSLIGDFFPTPYGLDSMLEFDGFGQGLWIAFCVLMGDPAVWMFQPRQSIFAYLQQTFGQYAYVHYNSSRSLPEVRPEDRKNSEDFRIENNEQKKVVTPLLSEAYAFDKQLFSQQSKVSIQFGGFLNIAAIFMGALAFPESKDSVNEEQNQSAVSDLGRKYQSFFVENVEGMIADNIKGKSNTDVGITSRIAGVKSLDMFYSTCDQQNVYAGPGYVEHQFVADCIAQSSTEINAEGKVIQVAFAIEALTLVQHMIVDKVMEVVIKFLTKQGEAIGSASAITTAIGAALLVVAQGLEMLRTVQAWAFDQVSKMISAINAKGFQANNAGYVSRHALTVEGKHKYGEKNETFMWPCWGVRPNELEYTDTQVVAAIKQRTWQLSLSCRKLSRSNFIDALRIVEQQYINYSSIDPFSLGTAISDDGDLATVVHNHEGKVPVYVASCFGKNVQRKLPDKMAKIEGVTSFMPDVPFKNENISVSEPVFPPSLFHDYIIDERWGLSKCATMGLDQWVSCEDTKLINCPPSNMVLTRDFCGVASSYTAVEVKRGISKKYMRPWAITPNVLALNCTGLNCVYDNKMYHAFDGISYRIVDWRGSKGLGMNRQTFLYSFQINDRLKRSNKFPANELQGDFLSEPVQAVNTFDELYTLVTCAAKEKGLEAGTIGEDKDLTRWAVPVFTEQVATLPAAVKTLTATPLAVVDGITSLCTDIVNNQSAYKAPVSVDFTLGKNVYRFTEDYICSVQTQNGVDVVTDLVPALGLQFIGASPLEAYFYSRANRCYYMFNGGTTLVKMGVMERFRNIKGGFWDFVNQEVIMPCLMTFKRLNPDVEDKDTETDNIIVPVLSNGHASGELAPPLTTIFNDKSWYKVVSLPAGLAYQGPNRVIINRSIFVEYMLDTFKANLGKWKKVNKNKYATKRGYTEKYIDVTRNVHGVDGWTYNQFVLVTSALGTSENIDCMFEWEITFCWPIEMDLIYGADNYACVCIAAETMTPGGKQIAKPTHVYLTKELFTRNGNYGYYSFRYQSKNGAGNRERLHIWSDQYIAISSLILESKLVSDRRTEQLTQQLDVQKLKEL